jgi:23S rRNA (adenine1618-N6)-methyltransferase
VAVNAYGDASIDFADPAAVKALNRAILKQVYSIDPWDVPEGYLCPPIPGRADCIHHLADLLGETAGGPIPRGRAVRVLDIGVGANCIYPLIGHREYGWRFLGSDIDPAALACAQAILAANGLEEAIQLRLQPRPGQIMHGLLREGELFDLTLCNPPFHASPAEARSGTERKWRQLGRTQAAPVLNFGGQGAELWCPGGEAGFIGRLVAESADFRARCLWFSSLVSKEANLPGIYTALAKAGAVERRTLPMAQGQKKSRLVAWTFLGADQRAQWVRGRWPRLSGRAAE